ncbi:MAG TPA: rhodanese-like domain-containing protein, partial [Chitinophagaceae bacterium]|nr:rhodanese-like domain-containing protein [Chitinophagaceae bacterium]
IDALPKNEAAFIAMNYNSTCRTKENFVIEIDAVEFNELRKRPSSIVIDVREKGERPLLTDLAHQQIPMSVFRERVAEITKPVVILLCQHGLRSLYAADIVLEEFGHSKKVYSLKGGLVKWSTEMGVSG